MYQPAHFVESRPEVLHALMRDHPLGLLITHGADGLAANTVPFLFEPGVGGACGQLVGHVARANPLWRTASDAAEVLVVFQGPQTYISPNWYPSKAETGKAVPTWNYVMVQARGRLQAVDNPVAARAIVTRLTATHEAKQARPWSVDDAPADYLDALLKAIVCIEIAVDKLEGKWKVSQNQPATNRAGVVAALHAAGGDEAAAMARLVDNRAVDN
ncbi:FMN-binding negative transcriptional regulator [uncultured Sphaerotilus sp.]|uniref:FMN-binding negative transcriptional regulator n=1 Tax=uncultured Sphaerotilus sp. TaxID=474984 RepID=UPI0030CA5175